MSFEDTVPGSHHMMMTWSLVLYPISWISCILHLCLFFSLICMRLKLNLVNGLYALDFFTSAVFIVIEVADTCSIVLSTHPISDSITVFRV